jgi:branched-chain amino acid transport system permease protein
MDLYRYTEKLSRFRWWLFALVVLAPVIASAAGESMSGFTVGSLIENLIIGLILGSVYALIALGYTLVYGVIKLINFAHGDIYMLGAFLGFYLLRFTVRWLNFTYDVSLIVCFVISLIISAAVCAGLAVLMERLAYRPLRKSSRIAALITAVGVSFLLENGGIIAFGANPKSYEPRKLEVYQLQFADNLDFNGARQIEIFDRSQEGFAARGLADISYARVRVISQRGSSEWSPVLTLDTQVKSDFEELSKAEIEVSTDKPQRLASIGYSLDEATNEYQLSWAKAAVADYRVNPIFSDAEGKELAFHLPIRSAAGEDIRVSWFKVVIVVITAILLWALNLLINKSMFGISMRALSFDMNAAKLMGVDTDKVIAQTFAIGGACAAIAGNIVGLYNQQIDPLMGILPGLKAFVAAVVGGIGSIPGAAVGGLIMGISEGLVKGAGAGKLADAMAFAILILVLLFRPTGIFGRTTREKV